MPCTIRLLKTSPGSIDFYDFEEYESLVAAAAALDPRAHLLILLGGDAGLRSGEMRALAWTDINFGKRQLCVERNEWRGHVSTTKGGRLRHLPLTRRLAEALREHRHLRGPLVLYRDDGRPLTEHVVQEFVARVARRANLRTTGPHMLRHTFCSHLAMRGAPARAIQELAGHASCRQRSSTCTSVPWRLRVRSDSWSTRHPCQLLETCWRRASRTKLSPEAT